MRTRRTFLVLLGLALSGEAFGASAPTADSPPPALPPDAGARLSVLEDEAAPAEEQTPAPSKPAASRAKARSEYVVASGDTMGGIALRHGVAVAALAAANGISRDATIRVGDRIIIPAPGETPRAPSQVHVVAQGNTLGGIAHRYAVTIDDLLKANNLRRNDRLRIGQKLLIPGAGPPPRLAEGPEARPAPSNGIQELSIRGSGAPAYYFEPGGPGRLGMKPVIVYVHGRGANPASYCRRWSRVARNLGWLICPSGPEDRGEGKRGWNNNWGGGRTIVMSAIDALRKKYGRRVQLWGNTLIGFSEGAYVAMNVGLREPKTFNRWLILGADTDYWGAAGFATLPEARGRVRKVYLITGGHDGVVGDAAEVKRWLIRAGVPVRVSTPKDMGHEVALEAKPAMYEAALTWLAQG